MTQYLLSVHMVEGVEAPSPEDVTQMYKDVDTVVDGLGLETYHLFHATRADLLRRLGRRAEAAEAYDAALRLTANVAERRFLEDRRRSVSP